MILAKAAPVIDPQSPQRARDVLLHAPAFIGGQTSCLRRALLAADATTTAVVLGVHARSHERWLALIAAAQQVAPAAAVDFVALYALQGRLAASLERASLQLLPDHVQVEARAMMASDLDDLAARALQHCRPDALATAAGVASR